MGMEILLELLPIIMVSDRSILTAFTVMGGYKWLYIGAYIISVFINFWGTLALYTFYLAPKKNLPAIAYFALCKKLYWDFTWTNILIIIIALASAFALFLPLILLLPYLIFAPLLALTEKTHGWNALKRSTNIVSGRWWKVFGRNALLALLLIPPYLILELITQLLAQNTFAFILGMSFLILYVLFATAMLQAFILLLYQEMTQKTTS